MQLIKASATQEIHVSEKVSSALRKTMHICRDDKVREVGGYGKGIYVLFLAAD